MSILVSADFIFSDRVFAQLEKKIDEKQRNCQFLYDEADDVYQAAEAARDKLEKLQRDFQALRDQRFEHYLKTPCWAYRV